MEGIDTSRLDELKVRVKDKLEETSLYKFKGSVSKLLGLDRKSTRLNSSHRG